MELGISSLLWEDKMSLLDAIRLVATYEIRNIEVKTRTPPHCDYKDSEYMRCLADLLGKHGVTITQLHPRTSDYELSACEMSTLCQDRGRSIGRVRLKLWEI